MLHQIPRFHIQFNPVQGTLCPPFPAACQFFYDVFHPVFPLFCFLALYFLSSAFLPFMLSDPLAAYTLLLFSLPACQKGVNVYFTHGFSDNIDKSALCSFLSFFFHRKLATLSLHTMF